MVRTAQEFIDKYTAEVEPLEREIALAHWEASLSGKAEDFERLATLEKQLVDVHGRPDEYAQVRRFREALRDDAAADAGADPLVARQIEILYQYYRAAQGDAALLKRIVDMETDLAREFNTYRATYRGEKRSNNHLEQILKTTRDPEEAREAWEALKQVGVVAAPRIVELVGLRNRHAAELGSPNYYAFALELKELDQGRLFAMLAELDEKTTPLFRKLKTELDAQLAGEFGIGAADLRPWHYRNPFFQQMPENEKVDLDPVFADKDLEKLTETYYRGIHLEIRDILDRSDLYEREGKDQHAFCTGIETPRDVRVLCNVRPTGRWMSTMLHEFGHAVYDRYIDPGLPYVLRRPAHTLTTEAIAMLNERFLGSADFLSGIAGLDRAQAEEITAVLRRHQRRQMLVFTRWVLVMTHFERAMYEDPGQDLAALWWDLVERFQFLDPGERRTASAEGACPPEASRGCPPDWASKIHLACASVYYQNYLLGEMNASQILAAMRRDALAQDAPVVGNPAVGAFLDGKIFKPGGAKPWNERLADATGEKLNARYFLNELNEI
ncbi:MAG TPA: M2 family metallopeptidase [Sumerlaeia bacterium]|nr:M2 family metallopeptidase [Sumerlaeia bacterium]